MKLRSHDSLDRASIDSEGLFYTSIRFGIGVGSILGAMFFLVGCGNRARLGEVVSGRVLIEGTPLNEGLITFIPKEGTPGSKVSATIQAGAYQVAAEDGLSAGTFRVEMLGLSPGIKAMAEGTHPSTKNESYREIDKRFNEMSELECNVTAGIPNVADFQVQYAKQ